MSDLTDYRAAKDQFFREHQQSPLEPEQRADFPGLNYYPENPALVFELEPEVLDEPEAVQMQTSDGAETTYLRWARIHFQADGRPAELTVYLNPGTGDLFLPFQDAGRGTETYGAGRYLEVEQLPDGRLHVDFNYAYNPNCAYNDAWSCPFPPPENRLNVHIRAGEKTFHPD